MIRQFIEMQKDLQKNMVQFRDRDNIDERGSAIAECIELSEELGLVDTHKTWKIKPKCKKNAEKELVDIMFFITQLIMKLKYDSCEEILKGLEETISVGIEKRGTLELKEHLLALMNSISNTKGTMGAIFWNYGAVMGCMGVSPAELLGLYKEKYNENMVREDFTRC